MDGEYLTLAKRGAAMAAGALAVWFAVTNLIVTGVLVLCIGSAWGAYRVFALWPERSWRVVKVVIFLSVLGYVIATSGQDTDWTWRAAIVVFLFAALFHPRRTHHDLVQ